MLERIRRLFSARNERLAERELRREAAEGEGIPVPHTGGALFDEPFQPTESIPGDDKPDGPPQT